MSNSVSALSSVIDDGAVINKDSSTIPQQREVDGRPMMAHAPALGKIASTSCVAAINGGSALLSPLSLPSPGAVPSPSTNMMSPRTPGMLSPSSSGGHDLVHDLPIELLHAGWRRFWSQREAREYFYNKITRESRWEMPLMPGQVCIVRLVFDCGTGVYCETAGV